MTPPRRRPWVHFHEISHRLDYAGEMAEQLVSAPLADKIATLQRVLSRITIYDDRIRIDFRVSALESTSAASAHEECIIPIDVPARLKRCGMAVRLIVHAAGSSNRRPDPKLVALLRKGHDWLTRLTLGRADSVLTIAKQEKVGSPYVTRLVYLGCLAPDIVERILHGQQPPELNAKRLLRIVPLSLDWNKQRQVLKMNS